MAKAITASIFTTTIRRLHATSSCTRGGWLQQRHFLTAINEPSPATREHPCTLILAEDQDFYETSWQPLLTEILTPQGISSACLTLSSSLSSTDSSNNINTNTNSGSLMDQALTEMASDLTSIPQVVLVARGPWMSWMAQLYLESLAVAGLVLVDPLPLDDQNSINQFELAYQKRNLQSSINYKMFQECMEHWDHWTLRLEPDAVPMMVMSSQAAKRGFVRAAENTVRRHAPDIAPDSPWDMSSSIPLVKLDPKKNQQAQGVEALQGILEWIDAHLV